MSSFPSRGKGTSPQFAVLWGGMWSPLPPGELESLSGARRGVAGPSFTALRDRSPQHVGAPKGQQRSGPDEGLPGVPAPQPLPFKLVRELTQAEHIYTCKGAWEPNQGYSVGV